MDMMKILILHDENFTKNQILDDLRTDGFSHLFKFVEDLDDGQLALYIDDADELWVFGDVKNDPYYAEIREAGVSEWQMA